MVNIKNTTFFGFWFPVSDEDSARYAVKMAGLPVLIVGVNALILACISAFGVFSNLSAAIVQLVTGLILTLLAFRLRTVHAGWVPLATVILIVFLVLMGRASIIRWQLTEGGWVDIIRIVVAWLIPFFCTLITINGFRGWRWFKSHSLKTSL